MDKRTIPYRKSLLSYPGGKFRVSCKILGYIPADVTEICSPFLGGGHIEIECALIGMRVYGYDKFEPLVNFWQQIIKNPDKVSSLVEEYVKIISRETFYNFKDTYFDEKDKIKQAAMFYTINKCSFSGTTFSGGYSNYSKIHNAFTKACPLKIRNFRIKNLSVDYADYKDSLNAHSDVFVYADPPYYIGANIYGYKGDMHKDFDHQGLCDILSKRNKWIMSYNDCDYIRELYKDYEIIKLYWKYSMSSSKKNNFGSEILILNI